MRSIRAAGRRGFTLIELLTVISIIRSGKTLSNVSSRTRIEAWDVLDVAVDLAAARDLSRVRRRQVCPDRVSLIWHPFHLN